MSSPDTAPRPKDDAQSDLIYVQYDASQEHVYLDPIRALISKDLSEPYSIYVYRYFLLQWGDLCYMALDKSSSGLIGVIISKLEPHHSTHPPSHSAMPLQPLPLPPEPSSSSSPHQPAGTATTTPQPSPPLPSTLRGYIAMLAVAHPHRNRGIATTLVTTAIKALHDRGAAEVVLETEVNNAASLKLYERLGFVRSKKLHRYYLNGNAAFRLVLYLEPRMGLGKGRGGKPGGERAAD